MTDETAEIPLFASAMNMIEAEAAAKNVVKLLASFQKALVEEGLGVRDALYLCNTWLASATGRGRPSKQ